MNTTKTHQLAHSLEQFGLPLITVLVFGGFALARPDTFLSTLNIQNVLGNEAALALVAFATMLPLIAGHLDLSLGANMSLSAVVLGTLTSQHGIPLPLALLATIAIGALVGLVNGILVTRVGVNALIATLGTASVIEGITFKMSHGLAIVAGIPEGLTDFGARAPLGIPTTAWVVIIVGAALGYVLTSTNAGRQIHLVGANPEAAQLVGLRSRPVAASSFVVAGALTAVAGTLSVAYSGTANPTVGVTYLLPAFAAAFLGFTCIRPGQFNVIGTIVAVLFLGFSVNGMNLLGAATEVEAAFNGLALILAVSLSTLLARARNRR